MYLKSIIIIERHLKELFFFFFSFCCWRILIFTYKTKIRALSIDRIWLVRILWATGKCSHVDRPAIEVPPRTPDARSPCHCRRIPSGRRARSFSGRTRLRDPGPWLVFCDHYVAEFLYVPARPVHCRPHPWLLLTHHRCRWMKGGGRGREGGEEKMNLIRCGTIFFLSFQSFQCICLALLV